VACNDRLLNWEYFVKPLILLILSFIIIGCGQDVTANLPSLSIDAAFQPVYDEFMTDAKVQGYNLRANQPIVMKFQVLEEQTSLGEIVGECSAIGYSIPNATITIDPGFWNASTPITKQTLLYHELGHCILARVHTPSDLSIMNAVIDAPLNSLYHGLTTWPAMVSELFTNQGN
jgi:hypothetical protein